MDCESHKHKGCSLRLLEKDVHSEEFLEYPFKCRRKNSQDSPSCILVILYSILDDRVSYSLLDLQPSRNIYNSCVIFKNFSEYDGASIPFLLKVSFSDDLQFLGTT